MHICWSALNDRRRIRTAPDSGSSRGGDPEKPELADLCPKPMRLRQRRALNSRSPEQIHTAETATLN